MTTDHIVSAIRDAVKVLYGDELGYFPSFCYISDTYKVPNYLDFSDGINTHRMMIIRKKRIPKDFAVFANREVDDIVLVNPINKPEVRKYFFLLRT